MTFYFFYYIINLGGNMKKRVLFISSTGGHLSELLKLKKCFKNKDYYIITEKTKSNLNLKKTYKKRVHFLVYGTKHYPFTYIFKGIYNIFKTIVLYFKIHPDYIITTGAHTAGPMCILGRLFGSRIIFIETFANIESKTLTGKLVYKFANIFVVQWNTMLKLYPKAVCWGWIF